MAVTEAEPGIEAQIYVNGAPLQEYDNDEDEDTPTSVTKYVEATAGAKFEVHYQITLGFHAKHDLCATAYVDGKYGDSHVCHAKRLQGGRTSRMQGMREKTETQCFVRKFTFSEVLTDDSLRGGLGNELMKNLKEVGVVSFKLSWVTVDGNEENQISSRKAINKLGIIPEKALKGRALSCQTDVGPQETTGSFMIQKTSDLYDGKPFAVFNFKYRSRRDLQALLVIPRSPSPVPLEERDINSLNAGELRVLLKRKKEREEAAVKVKVEEGIKRERGRTRSRPMMADSNDDDDEVSFISSKRRRLATVVDEQGRETIDLT